MRVIVKGKEGILKFWNQPVQRDACYRLIRYHIREECEEGSLLLNTVTGEMILLSSEEQVLVSEQPIPYEPAMDELIAHRFLVEEHFDDVKSVDQLRTVLKKLNSSSAITGYTIIPTSSCNARCFYCYESNEPHFSMTPETAEKVVQYIVAHCGRNKKILLHWFGGEPTLGENRIDQICSRLTEEGIEFHSTMISNGYLFSREMTKKAKDKWHLHNIQITLDGTETIYNQTKAYVNAKDNPFRRVLDNIAFLLDEKIRVNVRINLGFHNADDLEKLIRELAKRFADKKGFSAYVHELFEDEGITPVRHTLQERLRLEEIKNDLNKSIREAGCIKANPKGKDTALPAMRIYYCMADSPGSLQINPLGQFGKCEHYLYERLVGSLNEGYDTNSPEAAYWLQSSYMESCRRCSLYPSCGKIETCAENSPCFLDHIRTYRIEHVKLEMLEKLRRKSENESA